MTDGVVGYHALTRSQRDHLLAVATITNAADGLPNGQDVQREVERIRGGDSPSNRTTYAALAALTDHGLVAKEQLEPGLSAYELTADGRECLRVARGTFRLFE
jgi:DNA-binding PadR family transcriptional regulator